ncbi:metal ABC transporter substrate-binding protein [Luteococcus sp. Sow4_B9]|uniref:metal ABC transporter substrate-binding protein n=1 Tax=Luteococcus sp. Sow4_B9 TaxID=3438792 RepID=UPI003F9A7260
MSTMTRRLLTATACTALLAMSACGQDSSGGSGKDDKELKVVTAFYPLQFAAERVAGDTAEVVSLTNPGADAHSVELTPKQVASLSDADLVLYIKGFSSSIDKAVEQSKPANVIDAMTLVEPLEAEEHAHEDEAGHEGETAEQHAEHEHGAYDPHIWLDPENMVKITQAVEKKLAEGSADHAEAFRTNAESLTKELTALDQDFSTGLENCQRKEIVVSHVAFGYLTHAYGLEQIGIAGISTEDEPSPARIAEIQKAAKEHGITTIFYEHQASPAHSKAIARDLKLKTDVLDPTATISDASRGKDYLEVMQSNLAALKTANGCK